MAGKSDLVIIAVNVVGVSVVEDTSWVMAG